MAWFTLDAKDAGFLLEEGSEEWLREFTQWVETTFDGRVSRLNQTGLGQPIPADVIGSLVEYWYENIKSIEE